MSRGQKAAYNSLVSIISELVTLICGLILPRLILKNYGSAYNGLIQSVSQFLSVVALLRAGVGGATRAALYKSLVNKDKKQISAIIRATEIFMRKVALVFAGFVVFFSAVYPLFINRDFGWFFSASLIFIVSISTFVQYYFGITYQMLLQADQKQYISTSFGILSTVVNTVISVVLINAGVGIHGVKFGSAIAYCIIPLGVYVYVKRCYKLQKDIVPDFSSINQRWDAMFHQLAGFIHTNTDIMLLTFFTNLKEVSVYTTYCLIAVGLRNAMSTVTTGVEAAFGDIIARNDLELLKKDIKIYENLLNTIVCILFGAAFVLITPFIIVYTRDINDVNYVRYPVGYMLILAEISTILRQPYHSIAEAAGHYKNTKYIAIIQAAINLIISLLLVFKFGIVGLLVGTFCSNIYRDIAYRIYVSKNIVQMKNRYYIKRFMVSGLNIYLIYLFSKIYHKPVLFDNYLQWVCYAIIITSVAIIIVLITNLIFYRKETKLLVKKIIGIVTGIMGKNK